MSQTKIAVGTVGYPIPRKHVHAAADIVEITETHGVPPRSATAGRWRREAPAGLAFSVQLSRYLFEPAPEGGALPGAAAGFGAFARTPENIGLWERTVRVADALEARAMVLLTPVSFTPTAANRRALCEFLAAAPRAGRTVAWEPRGPWSIEQAAELAAEAGLVLAVDPLRDDPPPGEEAYFRFGPFVAMGTRVGTYDLERIAAAAAGFERATVVFDTARAVDDVRNLKQVLASQPDAFLPG